MRDFGIEVHSKDDKKPVSHSLWRSPRDAVGANKRASLRLVVVLALALIAGVVAWLVVGRGGEHSSKSSTTTVVSAQSLQGLVASLNKPVFWVGPLPGSRYQLEQRRDGQIYLRYLSSQTKPGTTAVLTVGTYPVPNAYAKTIALAKKSGWFRLETGTGGVAAFVNSARSQSVYFALPGLDYQIEVYDPAAGRAAELVQSGRALQVAQGERLGLTLGELEKKAASRTVYWTGAKPGVTYEYTLDPSGNVYLRYLPKGVAVGAAGAYPTVGTYAMTNATAKTKAAAGQPGAVRVSLAGAEAFYSKSKPTSVYVAFDGSGYQVEVYDPVPGRALAAVESRRVEPLR